MSGLEKPTPSSTKHGARDSEVRLIRKRLKSGEKVLCRTCGTPLYWSVEEGIRLHLFYMVRCRKGCTRHVIGRRYKTTLGMFLQEFGKERERTIAREASHRGFMQICDKFSRGEEPRCDVCGMPVSHTRATEGEYQGWEIIQCEKGCTFYVYESLTSFAAPEAK